MCFGESAPSRQRNWHTRTLHAERRQAFLADPVKEAEILVRSSIQTRPTVACRQRISARLFRWVDALNGTRLALGSDLVHLRNSAKKKVVEEGDSSSWEEEEGLVLFC